MITIWFKSGEGAINPKRFLGVSGPGGVPVNPSTFLTDLVSRGVVWGIDWRGATADEILHWAVADLDARVARALSRDRPVIINGTPYTDPARMKAVIHGSDMMVAVAADDSTGVHIIFLGPEDPDGPGD